MSEATRRTFLTTSGIGVAAVGAAAISSATPAVGSAEPITAALPDVSGAEGMLVAFVHDVRAGAVSLMVGEKEILVQDRDLVARLLQATAR